MANANFFKTGWSFNNHSSYYKYSKVLFGRNNGRDSGVGGSNQFKNCFKLLRFSTSACCVALASLGVVQTLRKSNKVNSWESRPSFLKLDVKKELDKESQAISSWELEPFFRRIFFQAEDFSPREKKCNDAFGVGVGFSSLSRIFKIFTILTPVHCADCTTDTICNCSCCTEIRNRQPPPSSGEDVIRDQCAVQNQDTKECVVQNQEQVPSPSCSNPPPYKSCQSCPSPSRSNPCSKCSDVDVEALSSELGGVRQVNWVTDSDLTHCFLIKQASQVTVDSVTRIVTETATAYEDYNIEYHRVMNIMMDALEESRKACGAELEVLDCKIVLARSKVDDMKKRIQELDMFLSSLEKLANGAAETAFMANAEYASIVMMERLYSLEQEVKRMREETKEKERDMLDLQALIIVESGKSLK